jgi:hypothetical protein
LELWELQLAKTSFTEGFKNQITMKHTVHNGGVSTSTMQLENAAAVLSFLFLGRQLGACIRRHKDGTSDAKVLFDGTAVNEKLDQAAFGPKWSVLHRKSAQAEVVKE